MKRGRGPPDKGSELSADMAEGELSKATGVLIIFLWKELCSGSVLPGWNSPSSMCCRLGWRPRISLTATTKGRAPNSLFYGEKLNFNLIASCINWQSVQKGRSDTAFCLSAKGLCEHPNANEGYPLPTGGNKTIMKASGGFSLPTGGNRGIEFERSFILFDSS